MNFQFGLSQVLMAKLMKINLKKLWSGEDVKKFRDNHLKKWQNANRYMSKL